MSRTTIAVKTPPSESEDQKAGHQQPKITVAVVNKWTCVPHYDFSINGYTYRVWEEAGRFYAKALHTGAVKVFKSLAARNRFFWALVLHLMQEERASRRFPTTEELEAVEPIPYGDYLEDEAFDPRDSVMTTPYPV